MSTDCMTAQKCNFPRSVHPLMPRKGRIDFPEDRTDRLGNIIMARTETNNEDILRTRLDMRQVLSVNQQNAAAVFD